MEKEAAHESRLDRNRIVPTHHPAHHDAPELDVLAQDEFEEIRVVPIEEGPDEA